MLHYIFLVIEFVPTVVGLVLCVFCFVLLIAHTLVITIVIIFNDVRISR